MYELPDMTQKQTVTVTATTYSDYTSQNTALQASASFDLTFLDACLYDSLITLTPVTQTLQLVNNYNGQPILFTYNPISVSPAWCDATVTCDSVVGPSQYLACKELDSNGKIDWTFDDTDYTDGLKPGTYTYTFNVQVGGQSAQFSFDVVLQDPCKNASIVLPSATTQTYVITDPDGTYTLQPLFSVSPVFCTYEITATYDSNVIDFNTGTQSIVIPSITDTLTPSNPNNDGSLQHEYPVVTTIIVTNADGTQTTQSVTTNIIIQNPCLNANYVSIQAATLADLEYTVGSGAQTYAPHSAFQVVTVPITHTLCGNLVYQPLYNGQPLDGNVLSYNEPSREFTVSTDDSGMSGQIVPYSIIGTLVNYPTS